MKKCTIVVGILLLSSCIRPPRDPALTSDYEPLLITRDAADRLIKRDDASPIEKAGKFYIYKDYVFVVEQGKGLHIYDNTNVNNPINVAFIHILNCTDLAIKDEVLYANQSTDLVAIDLTDFQNIKLVSRVKNVSLDVTPDGLPLAPKYEKNRPSNTIVVKYEKIKK